ncbi:MAG TPA: phosphoribosyl-ATP diphosphatase [Candidatus Sulfomarinibacteraceae bacterium]|nr:phosphoribosyl-ATP diphosphatase [Candidatus Sulfomarinibacteraceae bacterium]
MDKDILEMLWATLEARKAHPQPDSYTAHLLASGEDEIIKKVGEEAVEVILAAKGQGQQRLVEESADLLYHVLVLLLANGVTWDDVRAELTRRHQK